MHDVEHEISKLLFLYEQYQKKSELMRVRVGYLMDVKYSLCMSLGKKFSKGILVQEPVVGRYYFHLLFYTCVNGD